MIILRNKQVIDKCTVPTALKTRDAFRRRAGLKSGVTKWIEPTALAEKVLENRKFITLLPKKVSHI